MSGWGTGESEGNGMFMGIGLATSQMSYANILWCRYTFTNRLNDTIVCNDTKANGNSLVTNDTNQDIYNVTTISPLKYTRNSKSSNFTNFTATFTRPLITNDTRNDV